MLRVTLQISLTDVLISCDEALNPRLGGGEGTMGR